MAEFEIIAEGYFHRQERQWEHTRFIAAFFATQASGKVTMPEEIRTTIFDDESKIPRYKKQPKLTKQDVIDFENKWLKSSKTT